MAKEIAAADALRKQFEEAGFEVASPQPGKLELKKSGCSCRLERQGDGWVRFGPPYLIVQGLNCELEDRGYQKFWYAKSEEKRFPIRKVELETLHRFDAEVRYVLGQRSLYNESLGSTNARTVYDRLAGRPDQ